MQRLLALCGLTSTFLAHAHAQLLYDANGWEALGSPAWTPGSIAGQNGWQIATDPTNVPSAQDFHRVAGTTLLGTLTVTPRSGARMHRNTSSGTAAVWTYVDLTAAYLNRVPGNNTVVVSADFFLPGTDATSDHGHGFDIYDPQVLRLGYLLFFNSLPGVSGNPVLIFAGADPLDTGIRVTFDRAYLNDRWHHVKIVMDFETKRLEVFLNGLQVTGTGADRILRFDRSLVRAGEEHFTPQFADADLVSFSGNSPGTSHFFTDNYRVSAVRSITFAGTVALDGVPAIGDTARPVPVWLELRDASGVVRNDQVSVRPLATDGSYRARLFDVPDGSYRLLLRAPGYLARSVPVTVSGSGTVIVPQVTLLGGDANGDDAVDVLDLAELIAAFDSSDGDPNWNGGIADFNYDGAVDVFDLAILIQNFDQTGES